jgi:hypothetical protein
MKGWKRTKGKLKQHSRSFSFPETSKLLYFWNRKSIVLSFIIFSVIADFINACS